MMRMQELQMCMVMSATAAAIAATDGNRDLNTANAHVQTETAATRAETRVKSVQATVKTKDGCIQTESGPRQLLGLKQVEHSMPVGTLVSVKSVIDLLLVPSNRSPIHLWPQPGREAPTGKNKNLHLLSHLHGHGDHVVDIGGVQCLDMTALDSAVFYYGSDDIKRQCVY